MLTIDEKTTNEEIAAGIKQENAAELVPILYERVQKLLFLKAARAYNSNRRRFILCGYDFEDIRQECYFVFLEALKGYKPEQQLTFTTYLSYPFNNRINEILKCRNGRDTRNASERDPMRLDAPVIMDGEQDTTLGELIPDNSLTPHDEQICNADLVRQIRNIVDKLPEPYKEIVLRRYWCKQAYKDIAAEMGLTLDQVKHRCYDVPLKLSYKDKRTLYSYGDNVEKGLHFWEQFGGSPEHKAAVNAANSAPSYGKRQAIIFEAYEKFSMRKLREIVDKPT